MTILNNIAMTLFILSMLVVIACGTLVILQVLITVIRRICLERKKKELRRVGQIIAEGFKEGCKRTEEEN